MSEYILGAKGGIDNVIHESCIWTKPDLVSIGNHCAIDGFLWCSTGLQLGDYVHIGPHVSIIGGKDSYLKVGNFSSLAAGCRVICGTDNYQGDGFQVPTVPNEYKDSKTILPVIIEDFVGVCTGAIIMPGVTLAEGCVIASGCIVKEDTKPWTIYAGGPLMPVKYRPRENILRMAKEMGYR